MFKRIKKHLKIKSFTIVMGSSSSIEKKEQTIKEKVQNIKEPDNKINPFEEYMVADLVRRNHKYEVAYNHYVLAMYRFRDINEKMFVYLCYERMAEMQIHLECYKRAAEFYFDAAELGIIMGHTGMDNGSCTMCLNAFLCLLVAGQRDEIIKGIKSKRDFDCGLDGSVRPVEPYRSFGYHLRLIDGIVHSDSLKMYKNILEDFKPIYSDSEYRIKLVEKITSLQEERFKTCLIDEK